MIKLTAEQNQKFRKVFFFVLLFIVGSIIFFYAIINKRIDTKVSERQEVQLAGESTGLLKKNKESDLKSEIKAKEEELKAKEQENQAILASLNKNQPAANPNSANKEQASVSNLKKEYQDEREPLPPVPLMVNNGLPFPAAPIQTKNETANITTNVGKEGINNNTRGQAPAVPKSIGGYLDAVQEVKEVKETKEEAAKKKGRTVYIPSGSFMDATLLIGVHAPTAKVGNFSSAPTVMRVKTPAQLPNDVKENLAGCFVTASAVGSLADESAIITTASFSCVAKDKRYVIDQKLTGFVADSTGTGGVRGRVVAKLDKTLGYAAIAGALSGVGDVLKATSVTSNISAIGQTQTLDASKVGQAALGGSLTKTSEKLMEFYLMLAQQQVPVIEVGSEVPVTVVVQEGLDLVIKNLCEGEVCD